MNNRRATPLLFLSLFLIFSGSSRADDDAYGGSASKYISGNEVVDLSYSPKDSALFALTSSGLSYHHWRPNQANPTWNNFGAETFQSNLYFRSVAASDSTLFVCGYTEKAEGASGGNIYYKSKHAPAFHTYYPDFADDTTYLRLPYDIYIQDSLAYVSLFAGLILKSPLPPSAAGWRAMLFERTDSKTLLAEKRILSDSLNAYHRSLLKFRDTLLLSDSALFTRMKTLNTFDSLTDKTPAGPHYHMIVLGGATADSVSLNAALFSMDSGKLILDTFHVYAPLSALASLVDTLTDFLLPASNTALNKYLDTLRSKYDSLVTEIPPELYPPQNYEPFKYLVTYSLTGRDSFLFAGTNRGLWLASDKKHIFKNLMNITTSPFYPYTGAATPPVRNVAIQSLRGDSAFRVWVLTRGDTVACSGEITSTAVDSVTLFPVQMDSLSTWHLLDAGSGISDMAFFKDTVFISYSLMYDIGLKKFFPIDTIRTDSGPDTLREWRSITQGLDNFLEPQLGINTLAILPIDTLRYEIWAGTTDGLYRLRYGSAGWDYFEYKRPFESQHGETYAYPTVIQPGYKSAKIAYKLDKDANVTIEIFDFSMRKVRTLIKNQLRYGGFRSDKSQDDRWDGRDGNGRAVSPGVYYYKIIANGKNLFGKIVVFGAKDI